MRDHASQVLAAFRVARVSLLVCAVAGGWISGRSSVMGGSLRVVLGLVVAAVAAAALYRLADLRVIK